MAAAETVEVEVAPVAVARDGSGGGMKHSGQPRHIAHPPVHLTAHG